MDQTKRISFSTREFCVPKRRPEAHFRVGVLLFRSMITVVPAALGGFAPEPPLFSETIIRSPFFCNGATN